MTGGLDEEQAAVDTGILDISLTLGCELLSEVCRVLVLDVLDDWVPASIVVDLVTIAWGIDNVQPQTNSVFLDDVRDCLDFGGGSHRFVGGESSFRIDQVRRKDSVN